MKSSKNWGTPIKESVSETYSIHTSEKSIVKAVNLGAALRKMRFQLKDRTLYVVEFFDEAKEESSAFEAGVMTTTLFVWEMKPLFNKLVAEVRRERFVSGMFAGCVLTVLVLIFFVGLNMIKMELSK